MTVESYLDRLRHAASNWTHTADDTGANMTDARSEDLQQLLDERDALMADVCVRLRAMEPFAVVGRRIPPQWRKDVPLKGQTNAGQLPLVSDYKNLVEAQDAWQKDKRKP